VSEGFKLLGYVLASKQRMDIMLSLNRGIKTPKMLTEELGIANSTISNNLRDLRQKGLVECLNQDAKKGRMYILTKRGDEIVNNIKEILKKTK